MAKIQLYPIGKESPTQYKVYKQVKKGGSTGDGLFTEIQLAEWLNISRTSLAKAIRVTEGRIARLHAIEGFNGSKDCFIR
ncbi:hypothetical protein [Bacillus sp. mrc49]|uniref:hypothetical protein n=1 Tax=Bacillus sp. mrc49 TaxID=2054913 RepID=UPI000C27CB89|nr:hypothetical protein [Bacillus sp. mrc49]PJN86596.1 hypothetical protein CVN76_26335 [Bacillus sp. mrc49]